ncbi:hypothetical protein THAOC_23022, partial [Thalassiosira oceanica]
MTSPRTAPLLGLLLWAATTKVAGQACGAVDTGGIEEVEETSMPTTTPMPTTPFPTWEPSSMPTESRLGLPVVVQLGLNYERIGVGVLPRREQEHLLEADPGGGGRGSVVGTSGNVGVLCYAALEPEQTPAPTVYVPAPAVYDASLDCACGVDWMDAYTNCKPTCTIDKDCLQLGPDYKCQCYTTCQTKVEALPPKTEEVQEEETFDGSGWDDFVPPVFSSLVQEEEEEDVISSLCPQGSVRNLIGDAHILEVSSEYSLAYSAKNAIDGDASTEWVTQGDGDTAYITFELRSEANVVSVGFHSRTMGSSAQIYVYLVEVGDFVTECSLPDAKRSYTCKIGDRIGSRVKFMAMLTSGGN